MPTNNNVMLNEQANRWLRPTKAYGNVLGSARLKQVPAHFQVTERLSTEPVGEGEHAWVRVRKVGVNSHDIIQHWRKQLKLHERVFGLAGKKDKNAVAEQTISIQLPGQPNPDIEQLQMEGVEILGIERHTQKLRPAVGRGNSFVITLTECDFETGLTFAALEQRIAAIRAAGVPNYFGPQRFGRNADNAERAGDWFAGEWTPRSKNLQGLLLSAARSAVFNCVLSERVQNGTWQSVMPGEWLQFFDGNSGFVAEQGEAALLALQQRLDAGELQPTGPLMGEGSQGAERECLAFEEAIQQPFADWREGLASHRMAAARRSLICPVADFSAAQLDSQDIQLSFALGAGQYATTVLAELFDLKEH